MTRELFNQKLQQVQEEMLVMASMVEKAIQRSVKALKGRDQKLAQDIIRTYAQARKKAEMCGLRNSARR